MPVIKIINKKAQIKQFTEADTPESPVISNRVTALYDAVIGSTLQVNNGAATHTTFASALSQIPINGKILVLRGTYNETVTLSKNCLIEGQGYGTNINGVFTLNSGSSYSTIKNLRFMANLVVSSDGNFIRECFQATGLSIADSGTGNSILVIQE
jgi:hypothetical protein